MTAPAFVHLNLHSEYAIVDSTVRIQPLMQRLKDMDMPAVAVTDTNNLFAAVKVFKAAKNAGIKPIIGADVRLSHGQDAAQFSEATLLCMDRSGYRNLCKLLSKAQKNVNAQGHAVVMKSWLQTNNEGLLLLLDSVHSELGALLLEDKQDAALDVLLEWKNCFTDRVYVAIARIGRANEARINSIAIYMAAHQGVPLVASGRVRYLDDDEFSVHEARICINQGHILADPGRPRLYTEQQHLASPAEMAKRFSDFPVMLENTVEIARRCNFEFNFSDYYLPEFPVPEGQTLDEFFARKCREFLNEFLAQHGPHEGHSAEDYSARLEREIKVIHDMGFPGYFLIVADFIRWSKKNHIPVGPGRGSGAGSLVAYVLGITNLDPLRYELLFERFLNPERVSMPDFDVDFCMDRRDEVIAYVARTYGHKKVSQIITYGAMNAKAVIRDAGRVLGHPYGMVDSVAKLIPNTLGITIDAAMKESIELADRYANDDEVSEMVDLSRRLEGLKRNVGKHAGGIVIAPTSITDFCPIYIEQQSQSVVCQFDKDDVESIGLVKFDFLGLRTLTIIDWALKEIKLSSDLTIDMENIPLDDAKTFELLRSGKSTAVFQLESTGMQQLIKRLQPDTFQDIIALVALYRPGPLDSGMVDTYVECKHGRQEPDYLHPSIQPILQPTYGVILYQEQVMQIAQVLSGYTLGAADILRRAMGKKKKEVMDEQKAIFVDGAVANGVAKALAEHIFSLIETFAGYGFNKSHSAAYALISYQTAWLKAHHPVEFMASVLSADMDNTDKVVHLLEDIADLGIEVRPPDVNKSMHKFIADGEAIVYGLGAIKGVGHGAIEAIVQAREECGGFDSIMQLCAGVNLRKVNRRTLEALIHAGAFDALHGNRRQLIKGLDHVLKDAEQQNRDRESGQADLFAALPVSDGYRRIELPQVSEFDDDQRLFNERDVLGHFISGHPVDTVAQWLDAITTHRIGALQKKSGGEGGKMEVVIGGLITRYRRRSENMGSLTVEDGSGRVDVNLFRHVLSEHEELLQKDTLVVVTGVAGVDPYNNRFQIKAGQLFSVSDALVAFCGKICFQSNADEARLVQDLQQLIERHGSGRARVYVHLSNRDFNVNLKLGERWGVQPTLKLIRDALSRPSIQGVILKR